MLAHSLFVAWRSLRRSPGLTLVLVSGLGVGIGVAVTFSAVRHAFARHPLPEKEGKLFYVRLDSWDPRKAYPSRDDKDPLPTQITYRDMEGLLASKIPVRQGGAFRAQLFVHPEPGHGKPAKERVRLCFSDFFGMFDVPFRYGGPWDRKADAGPDAVVVLSDEMNDRLFGGRDSVGRTVRIEDREFRVVGVLDRWKPNLKVYDLTNNWIDPPEPLYIPFRLFVPMKIRSDGNSDGWGPSTGEGLEGLLASEMTWIQYWVELPDASSVSAYRSFLEGYIGEQKRLGRFGRPLLYKLSTIRQLLKDWKVMPTTVTATFIVGLLFLVVSAVNLIGLLLGKFLARAHESGVRRALGATRLDVFLQHLVECELVALLGGAVGVVLSLGGLAALNAWMKTVAPRGDLFHLDVQMLLLALGLSLAAGLLAGAYPSWRVCRLAPAIGLKE